MSVDTEWAEDSLIVEGTVASDAEVMGAGASLDRTIYDVRVDRRPHHWHVSEDVFEGEAAAGRRDRVPPTGLRVAADSVAGR